MNQIDAMCIVHMANVISDYRHDIHIENAWEYQQTTTFQAANSPHAYVDHTQLLNVIMANTRQSFVQSGGELPPYISD